MTRLEAAGPQGPAHRLGAGALGGATRELTAGSPTRRRSTSSTASPRARPGDRRRARHGESTASASPARSPGRRSTASSFTPRSRAPPACGCWRTSPAICARVVRLDLLPGDRHPRRPRGAARPGRLRARDGFDADPLDAARRWVEQGARALHVVDLDGARAGAPGQPRARARGSATRSRCRSRSAAGCARPGTSARCSRREPSARSSAPPRSRDPALVEALVAEHGERIVVSADARGGAVAVAGLGARDRG